MTDERAVRRFPNIEMCGKGCTSGSWNEWPVLRAECREILALLAEKDAERDRLAKQVERLKAFLHPDVIRRWWQFDSHQQPMSSWHERENFIERITAALTEQPNA